MPDLQWYHTLLVAFGLGVAWMIWDNFVNRRRWALLAKVPGPMTRPILGNMGDFGLFSFTDPSRKLARLFQLRYGLTRLYHDVGMYRVWIARKPVLFLTRASTVEALLNSPKFIEKGSIYKLASSWLGKGLVLSSGDQWRKDRKLLTPSFHFRVLDNFLPIMNEQSAIFIRKIVSQSEGKEWIDPQLAICMCTMDIICETALGVKIGAQKKPSSYALGIIKMTEGLMERLYRPWMHPDYIYYLTSEGREYHETALHLRRFTDKLIDEKLAERKAKMDGRSRNDSEENVKKKLAFLDLIIENNLSKTEIRDQISTFIFGGHDTTATTLAWALYVIGLEQEIQVRLKEEVDAIFSEENESDVAMEDLKDLKYMECFLKEIQRIYPAIPAIARKLTTDAMIGGYLIPKGTECGIAIASVHQDPTVYPEPERFDPDRFLPENTVGRNPYAFIPFSAGPRNCIGQKYAVMEMKILLCHVLRSFSIHSLDPRDKVIVVPEIVLRPQGKLRIQFKPRNTL